METRLVLKVYTLSTKSETTNIILSMQSEITNSILSMKSEGLLTVYSNQTPLLVGDKY